MAYLTEVSVIFRILLAVIFGGGIGIERRFHGRAAGMRTYLLVCLGSCLTMLTGIYVAVNLGFTASDPMRIAAQVVSGIGFLGAGTILVRGRFEVTGLTTAASLWTTAAVGICVGAGFYLAATIGAAAILVASMAMSFLEKRWVGTHSNTYHVYLEIRSVEQLSTIRRKLTERYEVKKIDVTLPRSGLEGNVGIELTIHCKWISKCEEILLWADEQEEVVYSLNSI